MSPRDPRSPQRPPRRTPPPPRREELDHWAPDVEPPAHVVPERDRRRTALTGVAPYGTTLVAGDEGLSEILADALDAASPAARDTLTHGFHAYPARMHAETARVVLEALAPAGGLVLDPFVGSGTVLIEARALGLRAVGTDLNPLALRLAAVKSRRVGPHARARFEETLAQVGAASEERVQARIPALAPLPKHEVGWWDGHVLKELAGLREEILAVADPDEQEALLLVLSAIVVKFSRQRADTAEERVERRIRKGLPTEFFVRKGRELSQRWAWLDAACPSTSPEPRLAFSDARALRGALGPGFAADLVLTSPPYGGTYDYVDHHARRYAWLGIDPRRLRAQEIGARRRVSDDAHGAARWDEELGEALASVASVTRPGALVVLLMGDGEAQGERLDADAQVARLAPAAGLEPLALASSPRAGGRREHLMALRVVGRATPRRPTQR